MSLYVNEFTGADEAGYAGSQQQPFKTAAFALFSAAEAEGEPKLFVFKKDEDQEGYAEITASALKKARKGAEGLKKKAVKQKEQEEKQKQQEVKDAAKKLEAMNISIVEDAS